MFEDLADEINNLWEEAYYARATSDALSVYLDGLLIATVDHEYNIQCDDSFTHLRLQDAISKYC